MTLLSTHPLIERLKKFSQREELYKEIMELGKTLLPFPAHCKKERYRVTGCQSLMYLYAEQKEGILVFYADSDALISKGLAALLLSIYKGQSAEEILKQQPTFLEEIGILSALTPSRANGVLSLYRTMQQEALLFLIQRKNESELS